MPTCTFCEAESPDGFKFCPQCGAPLAVKRLLPEERRIVTTLFCDIVGYTALSEAADAEDVDRMLRDYNGLARRVITSCGGTVEKYIGDAVVAVFGVPAVHEDDAERAVQAGLQLVAEIGEMRPFHGRPVRVRVGINTGEAYVRLDVDPASGETFVTGDAVNTAARLQGAAPPMGVVVGHMTYDLTAKVFEFEQLEPVALKGKSELTPAWRAKAARGYMGAELARDFTTPFIGRERELALLKGLFDKAVAGAPQFVLLVGEPGIGKSRILAQFGDYLDLYPALVRWRQGRCLPYGDGVTFWALGEIVKAEAGILDSDDADAVVGKLDAILPDGPDREWFRQRLRPLLGLEAPPASRDENFSAWRRFLEHMARSHPTVLVVEDVHWADEALLGFIDYLSEHTEEAPLLVVGLTRGDVFERFPEFASSESWTEHIPVPPLSQRETARLVTGLLETVALPPEVQSVVLERSGGNPLYAEEFTRLLLDHGLLERADGWLRVKPGAELPLPGSVQALIAARLDLLPLEHKAILADAAVFGRSFWVSGVAAVADVAPELVDAAVRAVGERRLIRRVRSPSIAGETEYMFSHGLAREVAYQELPRAVRAGKHAAVGRWFEVKAGDRAEDFAEVLAHHYAEALDLARALDMDDLAGDLLDPSVRFLSLAGDRAMGLDVATAERHYSRALDLLPQRSARRPSLLGRWGEALHLRGRFREAAEASQAAAVELKLAGDIPASAAAMSRRALALDYLGDPGVREVLLEAVELVEGQPPAAETATVFTQLAAELSLDDPRGTIAAAERAIELSAEFGLPTPVRALDCLGGARCDLGDPSGLDDQRKALQAAKAQGLGYQAAVVSFNLATSLALFSGLHAALRLRREGLEAARPRGLNHMALTLRMGLAEDLLWAGEWDETRDEIQGLLPDLEETEDLRDLLYVRACQLLLLAWRGDYSAAEPLLDWVEEKGAHTEDPRAFVSCLLSAATVRLGLGDSARAVELLARCSEKPSAAGGSDLVVRMPQAMRTALAVGERSLAESLLSGVEPDYPLCEHALVSSRALLSEDAGEYDAAAAAFADAAARWRSFEVPYESGHALLGHGRCLLALDRAPEAAPVLAEAREIFARLGAVPALGETDDLLARAGGIAS